MIIKKTDLINEITNMEMTPFNIEREFSFPIDDVTWRTQTPWGKFTEGINIHLGKRSGGWKFLWNFHKNKYYSNKEELLAFIRSGRVVNEYGELEDTEEFIEMALTWGQPDGSVYNMEYVEKERKKGHYQLPLGEGRYDTIVDGLVVCSSTDFS